MDDKTNLKPAFIHSALRRQGYTFAEALAAPAIRAVLKARTRAKTKTTTTPKQKALDL